MQEIPSNETRDRILDVAEELFTKRGYAGVTLRDIGNAVGIKHASLYYYAPDGKEQLFVEVMERSFQRHRNGLEHAIVQAGDNIRDQMHAVAKWLVTQPPMNIGRMQELDMPAINSDQAERLMNLLFDAMRLPLSQALEQAQKKGVITIEDPDLGAMALVSLAQSVHHIPDDYPQDVRLEVAGRLADLLLFGFLKR